MFTDEMKEEAFEFFCDDSELELYEELIKQKEMEKEKISKRLKRQRKMASRKNASRGNRPEGIYILGYLVKKSSTKSELKAIRHRRDRRKLNSRLNAELESAWYKPIPLRISTLNFQGAYFLALFKYYCWQILIGVV